MSRPTRPRDTPIPLGPLFQYDRYTSINHAEQRSGDIGFPIYSAAWLDDGSILIGGGGGSSQGFGVRNGIVAGRLVNGTAVDSLLPQSALIDPISLALGYAVIPRNCMVQAIGEINTGPLATLHLTHRNIITSLHDPSACDSSLLFANEASTLSALPNSSSPSPSSLSSLSSLSSSSSLSSLPSISSLSSPFHLASLPAGYSSQDDTTDVTTMISASMGPSTVIFDAFGFGSIVSSPLPPCRDISRESSENREYYSFVQHSALKSNLHAQSLVRPSLPLSTPFKSPLLAMSLATTRSTMIANAPYDLLCMQQSTNDALLPPVSSSSSSSSQMVAAPPSSSSSSLVTSSSSSVSEPNVNSLLAYNSHTLTKYITQLAKTGSRCPHMLLRFRSDFAHGESYSEASCIAANGSVVITGGNDGVIRAWLVRGDTHLTSTLVTHGVNNTSGTSHPDDINSTTSDQHNTSSTSTTIAASFQRTIGVPSTPANQIFSISNNNNNNNKNDILSDSDTLQQTPTIGWVAPLFIPIGYFSSPIASLDLSPDEKVIFAMDTSGNAALWHLPSPEEIFTNGVRIPIDYLDKNGDITWYPRQRQKHKMLPQLPPSDYVLDMSFSRDVSFFHVFKTKPLYFFPKQKTTKYIRGLFWSPPLPSLENHHTQSTHGSSSSDTTTTTSGQSSSSSSSPYISSSVSPYNLSRYSHLSPIYIHLPREYYPEPEQNPQNFSFFSSSSSSTSKTTTKNTKSNNLMQYPLSINQYQSIHLSSYSMNATSLPYDQLIVTEEEFHDLIPNGIDDLCIYPTQKQLTRYIVSISQHPTRTARLYHFIIIEKPLDLKQKNVYVSHYSISQTLSTPSSPSKSALTSNSLQLVKQTSIENDSAASALTISPNGQFIAVAGTGVYILTSPDLPSIRTTQLLATGHSASIRLSETSSLTVINYRKKFFPVPASSVVFDPSSHVVLAFGSRAITFVHVLSRQEYSWLNNVLWKLSTIFCPLYYLCCLPLCCSLTPPPIDPYAPPENLESLTLVQRTCRLLTCSNKQYANRRHYNRKYNGLSSKQPTNSTCCGQIGLTFVNILIAILVALFASQFIREVGKP